MSNECMSLPPLKPCPFCGGKAYLDREEIFCDCGITVKIPPYVWGKGGHMGFPDYETARMQMIQAWNRRVGESNE